MTYLRCDDCGFVAAASVHSLAGACPRCRTRGRIVRLTHYRRAASPSSIVRGNGSGAGERRMGALIQAIRARN
jgi:hypothetical protein